MRGIDQSRTTYSGIVGLLCFIGVAMSMSNVAVWLASITHGDDHREEVEVSSTSRRHPSHVECGLVGRGSEEVYDACQGGMQERWCGGMDR